MPSCFQRMFLVSRFSCHARYFQHQLFKKKYSSIYAMQSNPKPNQFHHDYQSVHQENNSSHVNPNLRPRTLLDLRLDSHHIYPVYYTPTWSILFACRSLGNDQVGSWFPWKYWRKHCGISSHEIRVYQHILCVRKPAKNLGFPAFTISHNLLLDRHIYEDH